MRQAVAVGIVRRVDIMSEVSRQDDENAQQWARVDSNIAANVASVSEFRAALRALGDPGKRTLPVMEIRSEPTRVEVRPAGFLRAARYASQTVAKAHRVGQYEGWELRGTSSGRDDTLWDVRDARVEVEKEFPWLALAHMVVLTDGTLASFDRADLKGAPYDYTMYNFSNTPSINLEQSAKVVVGDEAARHLGWVEPTALTSFLARLLRQLRG